MDHLEDGIVRITAPNPSPLTFRGTNTYIVGTDEVVVLDPGPEDAGHRAAILEAVAGRTCAGIIATHAHLDHTAGIAGLRDVIDCPVYGFGPWDAGRREVMAQLDAEIGLGGGEGRDTTFQPDRVLADGEQLAVDGVPLTAVHTPGHMSNHLCFVWKDTVFTGDHVMGWSTSLVSPPDGDLTAFMASCRRLAEVSARVFYPGHGDPVTEPAARLAWLMDHRNAREEQIRARLRSGGGTIPEMTADIYTDVAEHLLPAAQRNVLAHLVDLAQRGMTIAQPGLSPVAVFKATEKT